MFFLVPHLSEKWRQDVELPNSGAARGADGWDDQLVSLMMVLIAGWWDFNYGKSPIITKKLTISMVMFNSYVELWEYKYHYSNLVAADWNMIFSFFHTVRNGKIIPIDEL